MIQSLIKYRPVIKYRSVPVEMTTDGRAMGRVFVRVLVVVVWRYVLVVSCTGGNFDATFIYPSKV